jgi:prepilin-type N-terminal cleavage/methylation domain-containing protein
MRIVKNKKSGFSLVESLIVISIILILTAGVFVNYRQGQNQMNLQRTGYKIANDMRKTETMAGLMDANCCPGGVCTFPNSYKYSYGLFFDKVDASKYVFFADCDGDGKYVSGTDSLIETANLEANIVMNQINGGDALSSISFVFLPPEPTGSFIDNTGANSSSASISVKVNGTSSIKTIQVNKVGMIDLN